MQNLIKQTPLCYRLPILALFLCLIIVSGCSPQKETTLRIGTNHWPGYKILYLARELGYFEKSSIKLVELPSATEVILALRSGNLEAATLTLDEALTLLNDGLDLKVILVIDYSNGGDALLAKQPINSIQQLKGKNIAVEYTAVGAIILDRALKSVSIEISDVNIIGCTLERHIACFEKNDALVTFEPVRTQLLSQGAVSLFDSSKIPGKIIDVLVVDKKSIEGHEKTLSKLLKAYFKAKKDLEQGLTLAIKLFSNIINLPIEQIPSLFNGIKLVNTKENHRLMNGSPSPLEKTGAELFLFMQQQALVEKNQPIPAFSDERFIPDNQ
ncbi:MAG: ABC transporter substrate-binding protein [Enterobacterales bacterium]|nr:ABC transporter substrate-binding protein [Enterobacterales bacterium]